MDSPHAHEPFNVPSADPLGRPVDADLLNRLVAAAVDGCAACQQSELARLIHDPVTVIRLVELACVAVHHAAGGLPPSLLDDDVPGIASLEFRRLAKAGVGERHDAMLSAAVAMDERQRYAAASTALDLVVGYLSGALVVESPRTGKRQRRV